MLITNEGNNKKNVEMHEAIKSSGSTQEFSTGAHRDNPAGKGDCSLLPLDAVVMVMGNDPVLAKINQFIETQNVKCLAEAITASIDVVDMFVLEQVKEFMHKDSVELRDTNDAKKAVLAHMMIEVSKIYQNGAEKYGRGNWKQGMPAYRYIDSGIRHYLKTLRGDMDEPHYRGFLWNILSLMWTWEHLPEMRDLVG